ncbi:MAG: methylenetetrahydrofolate reductase [Kiloniellales bacterium]
MTAASNEKQQIIDLMSNFTIETTPGSAAKIADYREHLRPGTFVAVTFLPGSDFADTIKVAKRLRDEGFEPAPHFAARSVPGHLEFEGYLERIVGEAGVTKVVALAGGVDKPLGPFESSMDLLETGLFDKHGIKSIGVAGHPEGSPDISDADIAAALKWKNGFAERTDASVYICTQFCFESQPIIAWDKAIQAEGNRLPIHLGVPGLATLKTLIQFAKSSGVGNSIRFLTKQARQVTRLLTVNAPDQLVRELAAYKASDPKCGITHAHMYPLGGMRRSAAWSYAVLDGDFELQGKGFKLTRDIG